MKIYFKNMLKSDSKYEEISTIHTPKQMLRLIKMSSEYGALPRLEKNGLRDCQYNAEIKLEESFKSGKKKALAIAGEQLGIALGNFCNMISLDEIIICGEITKYEDVIIPSIEKSYNDTVIKQATAKISAKNIRNAAFGAARLAIEAYPYVLKRKNA